MAKCFLSYSSSYEHLKEPFRRLLEALGFETPVEVFDGPDLDAIPEVVIQKIQKSDAVVILYGPNPRPRNKQKTFDGAKWPHDEAVLARGMGKPLIMILHTGTILPPTFQSYSTPARFDFWNPQNFIENIHHVVKHILDFKKALEYLPGEQPFKIKKLIYRYHLLSSDLVKLEMYNEVVARKTWGMFPHIIDYHYCDKVTLPSPEKLQYDLEKRAGPESIQISMKFGHHTPKQIEYFITVTPDLEPGQELGYWRSFQLPNIFPMTRSQAKEYSDNSEFSKKFGPYSYGDALLVTTEIDSITFAFHFPRKISLKKYGVCVFHTQSKQENQDETERCKSLLRLKEGPDMSERVLEITVPKPIIAHQYYLFYELME